MIKVQCRACGKNIMWDDFTPTDFRCPKCGEKLNMHASLKDNIERRVHGEAPPKKRCPACRNFVERLWFARCPHCKRWLFGKRAISGNWFATFFAIIIYIIIAVLYYFQTL